LVAKHGCGYVLGVTSDEQLCGPRRAVAEIADAQPQRAWQTVSCGPGAKGPRVYQWIYQVYDTTEDGWCSGLLVRRHPKRRTERAYYLTRAPMGTPLQKLVEIAGRRWTIESGFEQTKGEVGLDQYEVRRFDGWLRHITLALLAHAFLAAIRARSVGGKISTRTLAHSLAAHRAGSTPTAHRIRVHVAPSTASDSGLVTLAPTSPAARQAVSLEPSPP
jgi:SRSO17 transposase